ncbi:NAD(P)-dependent oxidoreductase [Sphingosinicellaceae bacterium]|nr:NAD(P)-dependent oxidoreductase [Sphingosinicellaceae bacterium]
MTCVLVTGGSGFVGRAVVPLLIAAGHDVHLLTREGAPVAGCNVHRADLLGAVPDIIKDIAADTMLHLAWYAKPGAFWHAPENLDWVAASLRLVRAFAAGGGKRLVGVGTCAEYDWGFLELDEVRTPLRPHTLYGTAKASLYQLLATAATPLDLSFGWARIFYPYGPHEQAGRLLSSLVDGARAGSAIACTSGWQSRDFMHVDDVARALVAFLSGDVTGAVNIAQGRVVRVRDFIETASALAGGSELVRLGARATQAGEPIYMGASVARLRDEVGFVPVYDLAAGIADAVARRLQSAGRPVAVDDAGR